MSGHTPGPWRAVLGPVLFGGHSQHLVVEDGKAVYKTKPGSGYVGGSLDVWSETGQLIVSHTWNSLRRERDEANARLISAAPELLETLKLCAAVCAGEVVNKNGLINALEAARAAIAKATGGSHA